MSASNKHTYLRQAIASVKEACTRTIRSRGSEYQLLLHQEVVSNEQNPLCYHTEKPSVNIVEVHKASATKSRFEPHPTRKLNSAEFADMLHREAMFHYMAMRL